MEAHKVLAPPLQLKPINQFLHLEVLWIPWGNTNGATVAIFEFPLLTPPILRFFAHGGGSGVGKKWSFGGVKSGNSKIATVAPFVLSQGILSCSE